MEFLRLLNDIPDAHERAKKIIAQHRGVVFCDSLQRALGGLVTEQGLQTGDELRHLDRLDKIILCSRLQRIDGVGEIGKSRHHDDVSFRRCLNNERQRVEATHVWHFDIQQNGIVLVLPDLIQGGFAVGGIINLKARAFEPHFHGQSQAVLIINNKNSVIHGLFLFELSSRRREGDAECCSLTLLAGSRDLPAMGFNDQFADCKPKPGSLLLRFLGRGELAVSVEKKGKLCLWNPHPAVGNGNSYKLARLDHGVRRSLVGLHFDRDAASAWSEFIGIAQQVHQHLAGFTLINPGIFNSLRLLDMESDVFLLELKLHGLQGLLDESHHRRLLLVQRHVPGFVLR